jgi:hypothetical protein
MNDMTPDPTIDQRIVAWLTSEAPTQLPDRVLSRTFVSTRATRQIGWLPGWRSYRMRSMPVAIAAGAVAILVVVIGGVALIGSQNSGAAPSPSPSVTATAGPTAAAAVPPPSSAARPSSSAVPGTHLGTAIVNLDGSVRQDLGLPVSAWAPSLARDGTRVAYVDGNRLWIQALFSPASPRQFVANLIGAVPGFGDYAIDANPAWSPDSTRIAYASGGDIYVASADGAVDPRRLTTDPRLDEWPAWSPDGRTIYYVNEGATALDESEISPTQEVWKVPSAGGTPQRVSTDDVSELQPDIARSGQMAVWQDGQIMAMDPSNGRSTNIRSTRGSIASNIPDGWNPRWSPDGSKLALLVLADGRTTEDPTLGAIGGSFPLMWVEVFDLTTGGTTVVGPRVAAFWNPVSWTADGQALLINRYDCMVGATGKPCK